MLFHGPLFSAALFELPGGDEGFPTQIIVSDNMRVSLIDLLVTFINQEPPESVLIKIASGSLRVKIREI